MIDTHCHILPGLDDGPKTLEQAVEMARQAVAEGIRRIVATPHHGDGRFENAWDSVEQSVQALNRALAEQDVPLQVAPGQEIRLGSRLIDELYEQTVRPIGGRYVLVELPPDGIPGDVGDIFHELEVLGITPVIAHPERHRAIQRNPRLLESLICQGALSQVTAQAVAGSFGRMVQEHAVRLCRKRLVHFLASDAHNGTTRPFRMRQAVEFLRRKVGMPCETIYRENAERLIKGAAIVTIQEKWG